MHRGKAARYRSKQRKEGIIMLRLSLKNTTKLVFRATAASKTFSTGTILGQFSGNQTLHHVWSQKKSKAYTENTTKPLKKKIFWPGKNLTPHHYWDLTAPCAPSSVGKTGKTKPLNQFTRKPLTESGLRSSATSAVSASFCSGMMRLVKKKKTVYIHSHTARRVLRPRPEDNTAIDGETERQNTDGVQAGRVVHPATSAHKTQRHQPKTFKYTTFVEFYCRGSIRLPHIPETLTVAKTASRKYCSTRSRVYPPYSKYIYL